MRLLAAVGLLMLLGGCGALEAPLSPGGWADEANMKSVRSALASRDELQGQRTPGHSAGKESPAPTVTGSAKNARTDVPTLSVVDVRKVVYTGDFTLLVTDVAKAQDQAKALAQRLGGYMQRMQPGAISIRVPAAKFDQAVEALSKVGTVASRNIRADDVTEDYYDLATRLKNAKALQERTIQLLAGASAEGKMALERELARITTEIELLEGKLNRLQNQVAFGTLNLSFSSPVRYVAPPSLNIQLPFDWLRGVGLGKLLQFNGSNCYSN